MSTPDNDEPMNDAPAAVGSEGNAGPTSRTDKIDPITALQDGIGKSSADHRHASWCQGSVLLAFNAKDRGKRKWFL